MNQSRTHFNSNITTKGYTKIIHHLLLLSGTAFLIISAAAGVPDQYVQASLTNQTVQSGNQTAGTDENVRAGSFGEDRISGAEADDIIIGLLGSDIIDLLRN